MSYYQFNKQEIQRKTKKIYSKKKKLSIIYWTKKQLEKEKK